MAFKKITEEDMRGKGNVGQPVTPGVDTAEMQRIMDELPREVIAPTFNKLIDDMKQTTGAAEIGMKAPENTTGITAQDVVNSLNRKTDNHIASKENPHNVTAAQVDAYTKAETDAAINDKIFQIGSGDMSKAEYTSPGSEGIVRKAEVALNANKLSGKTASEFADAADAMAWYGVATFGNTIALKGSAVTGNIKFVAPVTYESSYGFTVNGDSVTAKTLSGESLWPGFFAAGSVVTCYKNGSTLTFNAGGLTAADKETVREYLAQGQSILGGSVSGSYEGVFGVASASAKGSNGGWFGVTDAFQDARGIKIASNGGAGGASCMCATFEIVVPGEYKIIYGGSAERYVNKGSGFSLTIDGISVVSGSAGSSESNQGVPFCGTLTKQLIAGQKINISAYGGNGAWSSAACNLTIFKVG